MIDCVVEVRLGDLVIGFVLCFDVVVCLLVFVMVGCIVRSIMVGCALDNDIVVFDLFVSCWYVWLIW